MLFLPAIIYLLHQQIKISAIKKVFLAHVFFMFLISVMSIMRMIFLYLTGIMANHLPAPPYRYGSRNMITRLPNTSKRKVVHIKQMQMVFFKWKREKMKITITAIILIYWTSHIIMSDSS